MKSTVFLSFLIIINFFPFASAGQSFGSGNKKPIVIAHRGASGIAPENTLAAVKKAMDAGADIIEIDVHLTQDRQLVVMHDETVDRTTNGTGKIKDLTLKEIKALDAGEWFSKEFGGESAPTLEEVMKLIAGKHKLLIEIKPTWTGNYETEKQVLGYIKAHDAASWCIIQSFDSKVLENVRELDKSIEIHKLVILNIPVLPLHYDSGLRWGSFLKYKQWSAISVYHKKLNKNKIRRIQDRGQKVFTWTVNEIKDMDEMIAFGVDGIITDFPDRLAIRMRLK
jgi:glycerophosphoryl diester phosphodiesterase